MQGLLVFTLRDASGVDCTNRGLSSKHAKFVLCGEGLPEIFEPSADSPALVLVNRQGFGMGKRGYWTAYTADENGQPRRHGMFGGNYVTTSDSRRPFTYPVPIHDRFE